MKTLKHVAQISLVTLAGAVISLGGCAPGRGGADVQISGLSGERLEGGELGIDIQNARGMVHVEVVKDAELSVRSNIRGGDATRHAPDWAAASLVSDQGKPVLRILCTDAHADREVVLWVRVPSCGGIRVRNAGGRVELLGVGGVIDVQNSMPQGTMPSIKVVAGSPITTPVGLHTDFGGVELRLPVGSTGAIKVVTEQGHVRVDSANAEVATVTASGTRWAATLGGGTNPIDIATQRGDVVILTAR